MLPKVTTYTEKDTVELFGNTGIQFLDLALALEPKREPAGVFAQLSDTSGLLVRLFENTDGRLSYEVEPEKLAQGNAQLEVSMADSLALLDGVWLPIPFFRYLSTARFDQGPNNWARMRIVKLPRVDEMAKTHRITLAFDTRILPKQEGVAYLAPNQEDLSVGQVFRLAVNLNEMRWFMDQRWVQEWLVEVFKERSENRDRLDVADELNKKYHFAHYLNVLSLLRGPAPTTRPELEAKVPVPKVVVKDARADAGIDVDLVLDVGNSRTCGILVEDHKQTSSGLHDNAELVLRDMTAPEYVYDQPFESRVEFAKVNLGKEQWSSQSGRHDAFTWVTMTRVGVEAARLAALRDGTEGSTGLSSPKRYLWDERYYQQGWRFNISTLKEEREPIAVQQPLANLINERGNTLYMNSARRKFQDRDEGDDESPVFDRPRYSRSALMTLMLNEVFAQVVMQINSVLYRADRQHASKPRVLRTVILTVPPGMPQIERMLFKERVQHALGLLWKSMGWHTGPDNEDPFMDTQSNPDRLLVPLPKVVVKWDEATCGQLVYLYTEAGENFGGHPEEFFDVLARPGKPEREKITIASIDVGGGTTDLVINDYALQRAGGTAAGSNVPIVPMQRFRDGFKVAGDDIVLDVIRKWILPSFEDALKAVGVAEPGLLADEICGARRTGAKEAVLRQQLTLQVFYPLALALLSEYEQYDLEQPVDLKTSTYAEWLGTDHPLSDSVCEFVTEAISRDLKRKISKAEFDLGAVRLSCNPAKIHAEFMTSNFDICGTLAALCEVVNYYDCDVLLLTGRPSRLPGVQALIRSAAPMPPGRILCMQNYRTGSWFPFNKAGRIVDPKVTASVGAMICWLSDRSRIPNFHFRISQLRPMPLIRHFGTINFKNEIKKEDVLFSGITTSRVAEQAEDEEGRLVLPGEGPHILLGDTRLGYRQLAAQRWPGTPLYTLGFKPEWFEKEKLQQEKNANLKDPSLRVFFKVDEADPRDIAAGLINDKIDIDRVEQEDGQVVSASGSVNYGLNTMRRDSLAQDSYWLDSGSVKN